ncbi:MAG: ribosomal protein S18-alanine N-acetyltransferase [Naasia sp.]
MTYRLRRATPDDLGAIMALERASFPLDAWSEQSMSDEISGPHGHYLVAETLEEPPRFVGYAGLRSPRGSSEADVQTIAVAPEARRHGLGRALVLALLAEARRRGAREVFLEVRVDNEPAATLYRSLGFEEIAIRPRYYQPEGIDALIMRRTDVEPRTVPAVGVDA